MDSLEEIVLSPDQRLSEECAPIGVIDSDVKKLVKRMCERYGVASDPSFFGSIETLSLRDECGALYGEKHVGTSADDLYEEICAYVTDKYEHEISTLPGCEAFLRTMHEAGIPMAIASSSRGTCGSSDSPWR